VVVLRLLAGKSVINIRIARRINTTLMKKEVWADSILTPFNLPIFIVTVKVTYCCNGVLCNAYYIFHSNSTLKKKKKNVKCTSLP
jgi:hypothetical protein